MIALTPLFLYGLLAFIIPLAIHLWSKKNRTPLPFGSIRFIISSTQRALRRITPSDFWIFLLRILTILFLVALLADIRFPAWKEAVQSTYYIDSVYTKNPEAMDHIKKLSDTARVIWMPVVSAKEKVSMWQSIATPNDVIISPLKLSMAPNQKSVLENLSIQSWPEAKEEKPIGMGQFNGNQAAITGIFDENTTRITYDPVEDGIVATQKYYLHLSERFPEINSIVRSAIATINEWGLYKLEQTDDLPEATVIFWMTDQPVPIQDCKIIAIRKQIETWKAIDENTAYLSMGLDKETALQTGIIDHMYDWLSPYRAQIDQNDRRISLQLSTLTANQELNEKLQSKDLRIIWWVLLLVCVGLERWFATK